MERKKLRKSVVVAIVSVLAWGCVSTGSASATPLTKSQANAEYASAIAQARANFLVAVRPSRATMIDEGKRAEALRRTTVKQALAAFTSVVAAERLASLTAEKTYKASVVKLNANPSSASLKAAVKTNLAALMKATSSLTTDVKITAARSLFAKARTTAMAKFKSTLQISANERARTLERATLRYKADKARAAANLQAALKKATN